MRFIGISELSEADGAHAVLQQAIPTGLIDVVMLTINLFLQTAIDSVLPLCTQFDVGTVVMMPLNQASHISGLVSREAALECLRRHVSAGTLPAEAPYTDPAVLKVLDPYPVPEISLRFVLAQQISTCCVGMQSPERLRDNLRAVDPPYVYPERLQQIKDLFGRIQQQVR